MAVPVEALVAFCEGFISLICTVSSAAEYSRMLDIVMIMSCEGRHMYTVNGKYSVRGCPCGCWLCHHA